MSNEAPKSPGVVTLRYVVMSYLNRKEDYTMRNYKRLMQICIEGYGELNLWHLDNVEVVYLTMSPAKTVSVPEDFVDWNKIGIPINGKMRVITNHNKLLLPRTFEDGTEVGNNDATASSNAIFFVDHFRNGQFVAGLFGLSGGIDNVYYRFDREKRQFVFSGEADRSQIVLEYVSNGVSLDGSTQVPREAVPALRSYLAWQDVNLDSRVAQSEKMRLEREYDMDVSALVSFQTTFTKEEYLRHVYKSSKQTPKR